MSRRNLDKEKRKQSFLVESLDWLRLAIICLAIVYFVPTFVVRPLQVNGPSMQPTFVDQEFVLTNVFANLVFGVDRFDTVVVKEPESGDLWVKRIIALPGESVAVKGGVLYIDDVVYEEPYLDEQYMISESGSAQNFTKDFSAVTLGEDEYFVMGDNRNHSLDSRARGPFKRTDIIGKHVYVLYPFENMKVVTNGK